MSKKPHTRTTYWTKVRKKAPKVPNITCPAIDEVITKIEKLVGKNLNKTQFKLIEKKIEKLRRANEQLRDSGVYWHDTCKETVRDLLGKKKSR